MRRLGRHERLGRHRRLGRHERRLGRHENEKLGDIEEGFGKT